jgi:GNAT superfamily N-acetyltransferase
LSKGESIIFLAFESNQPIGFVQLYTSFSSVYLQPIFILNDLYVDAIHRSKKVGELLLLQAKAYCKEKEYKGLALETAMSNPAQQLYERLGWEKDTDCFHYFWTSK